MRVSIGTAQLLGLKQIKTDALSSTAYLMHGQGCQQNCKFCAQAVESTTDSRMLSRVSWPEFSLEEIVERLRINYRLRRLKRCCLQVVGDGQRAELAEEISALVATKIPLSISKNVTSSREIGKLFQLGVERLAIALDVANPEIYRQIKGGFFLQKQESLIQAAQSYPGKISTHIIVGLGETEEEIIKLISDLSEIEILVALFAFTPLKGTGLADHPKPNPETYRRVQIARYLITEYGYRYSDFQFSQTSLIGLPQKREQGLRYLLDGKAFQTSGCQDCNRPYYNERPGGFIYNYPRPLTPQEIYQALQKTELWPDREILKRLEEAGILE